MRARRVVNLARRVAGPVAGGLRAHEAAVESAMQRYRLPHLARHAPAASRTWEVRAELTTTDEETARIPLQFPHPMLIVGFHAVITPSGAFDDTIVNPLDAKYIDCKLDIDEEQRLTSRQELAGAATGSGSTFVSLASLVMEERFLFLELSSPKPELAFTFRSRLATAGASNLGTDVVISLAAFVVPLGG